MGFRDAPRLHVESREELRDWLAEHHATSDGVWLVRWRPATGRPAPSYDDAIEEALGFGWIDGQSSPLDDERSMLWLTRRRAGSGWSRLSKERLARVEAAGLLTEAGARVVEAAKADGSWTRLDDVEALVVPPDLAAALAALPGARAHWDAFRPGARKETLRWIVDARRPATRAARVEETARLASEGRPAHQQVSPRPTTPSAG